MTNLSEDFQKEKAIRLYQTDLSMCLGRLYTVEDIDDIFKKIKRLKPELLTDCVIPRFFDLSKVVEEVAQEDGIQLFEAKKVLLRDPVRLLTEAARMSTSPGKATTLSLEPK